MKVIFINIMMFTMPMINMKIFMINSLIKIISLNCLKLQSSQYLYFFFILIGLI
jgi:hypothetical protein